MEEAEATNVDVMIDSGKAKTTLTISDNGRGFECQDGLELAKTGKLRTGWNGGACASSWRYTDHSFRIGYWYNDNP